MEWPKKAKETCCGQRATNVKFLRLIFGDEDSRQFGAEAGVRGDEEGRQEVAAVVQVSHKYLMQGGGSGSQRSG